MWSRFNSTKYGLLLAKTQPVLIQNDKELERISEEVRKLATKRDKTPEEERLQDLLDDLVLRYENEHHAINTNDISPTDTLKFLIEESGTTQAALARDIGISRGVLGDILKGRRGISKEIAKALATRFKLRVDAFL
jgi:HTH-type transcriptional regulator/antitoxin HigA